MLWITSQRLIAKHGYSETLFPPQPFANGTVPEGEFYKPAELNVMGELKPLVPKHGNSLMLQYVDPFRSAVATHAEGVVYIDLLSMA